MKQLIVLLLLFSTVGFATDFEAKYNEAQKRLTELNHKLYIERTKNIALNKEYAKIQPLRNFEKRYRYYTVDYVSDDYKKKFKDYYDLLRTYKTEHHTFLNNILFNTYTLMNFPLIREYATSKLSEVTVDRNNTVYINGEKLVKDL